MHRSRFTLDYGNLDKACRMRSRNSVASRPADAHGNFQLPDHSAHDRLCCVGSTGDVLYGHQMLQPDSVALRLKKIFGKCAAAGAGTPGSKAGAGIASACGLAPSHIFQRGSASRNKYSEPERQLGEGRPRNQSGSRNRKRLRPGPN
jgi:hypothetical protein